jgi:hypothetical protein
MTWTVGQDVGVLEGGKNYYDGIVVEPHKNQKGDYIIVLVAFKGKPKRLKFTRDGRAIDQGEFSVRLVPPRAAEEIAERGAPSLQDMLMAAIDYTLDVVPYRTQGVCDPEAWLAEWRRGSPRERAELESWMKEKSPG